MRAIRSTFGADRYVSSETDIVLGSMRAWRKQVTTGVLFCHAANADTAEVAASTPQMTLLDTFAKEGFTVCAADLGGTTFANDTGMTRMTQAVTYMRSEWGVTGPLALVGLSMGGAMSLNYALRFPEDVACIAAVVPVIDIADIRDNNRWGIGPDIDAAYPPAYDDVTDGPTHSPIRFATALDSDLPIHLYTSNDDTLCLPSKVGDFQTLRPQTGWTQLGNYSHGASAIPPALEDIVTFVKEHTS